MPMMISPYSQTLSTTTGHCIAAVANTSVWIPPDCVSQALSVGFTQSDAQVPQPEVVAPIAKVDNTQDAEAEFQVGLDQALLRILTRNDPLDFKKTDNTPKVDKVIAEMSPDLRRPTGTEISEAFQRLQENIDLAE